MFAVPKAVGLAPADSGDGSGCAAAAKVRPLTILEQI